MASPASVVFALGAIGTLIYAVSGSGGGVDTIYNGPADKAYSVLAQLPSYPVTEHNLIGRDQPEVTADVIDGPDQSVTWRYRVRGKEFGKLVASVKPIDANQSKVDVVFEDLPFDPGTDEVLQIVDLVALRRVVNKVTQEQVLAAIEERPVDKKTIQNARLLLSLSPQADFASAHAIVEAEEKERLGK